jgi:hypothetical protein
MIHPFPTVVTWPETALLEPELSEEHDDPSFIKNLGLSADSAAALIAGFAEGLW